MKAEDRAEILVSTHHKFHGLTDHNELIRLITDSIKEAEKEAEFKWHKAGYEDGFRDGFTEGQEHVIYCPGCGNCGEDECCGPHDNCPSKRRLNQEWNAAIEKAAEVNDKGPKPGSIIEVNDPCNPFDTIDGIRRWCSDNIRALKK